MAVKIEAKQVSELRQLSGCGLLDCKRALEEAEGDIKIAVKKLREKGAKIAEKKASREASEGGIFIKMDSSGKRAVMLEINCETDFVARDSHFSSFAEKIAELALSRGIKEMKALLDEKEGEKTIEQLRQELVGQVGENIVLRRLHFIETSNMLSYYKHQDRIGVLVELEGGDETLAKDLAMQIAAINPLGLTAEDIDEKVLEAEREIYEAQFKESGKPETLKDKMVEGRLKKFVKEVALMEQPFVKDPNMTITALLSGKKAAVKSFVRFELGEKIS